MPSNIAPIAPHMETYLTPQQAAERLSVEVAYLTRLRYEGGGPPYVKIGARTVRYPAAPFDEYIAARTFTSTSAQNVAMANAVGR